MTSDEKNVLRTHDPDAAVLFYVCTHDNKKRSMVVCWKDFVSKM